MNDTRFLTVTWNDIQQALFHIAEQINHSGVNVQVVVGVLRGGWIPARIIADLLGVSEVGAIEIKFYKGIGERGERPVITQPLITDVRGKEVLIIDDVADTGKSIQTATTVVGLHGAKTIRTATLYIKPWSTIKPDFYYAETDRWIVFPWELREIIEEYIKATYKVLPRVTDDLSRITDDIAVRFGLPRETVTRILKLLLSSSK
ncbi:MAG: phosphoribosyltransferase [Fervidicoccaceae archaeon]|nr:phosphoribosyltransferase [Fervidicoccaceae archaeon]